MSEETKGNEGADERRPPLAGFTSFVGLAERYRPRSFNDLIGQPEITEELKAYLSQGALHRAILLSGRPGVGKTSTSRIIGACLNCEKEEDNPTIEPCGTCGKCERIFTGNSSAITELDGMTRLCKTHRAGVQIPPRDLAEIPAQVCKKKPASLAGTRTNLILVSRI